MHVKNSIHSYNVLQCLSPAHITLLLGMQHLVKF